MSDSILAEDCPQEDLNGRLLLMSTVGNSITSPKATYMRPIVESLGSVAELTTGGTGTMVEGSETMNTKKQMA